MNLLAPQMPAPAATPVLAAAPGAASPTSPEGAAAARPLVQVSGLKMYFPITSGILVSHHIGDVKAVDGIDLSIQKGETLSSRFKASTEFYYVIRGSGQSRNGDDVVEWAEGDAFSFTGGGETTHQAKDGPAVLFLGTDEPVLSFGHFNPPEPAILGIGKVVPTPVARNDGQIAIEHRCTITLCVDHRVCSGRYAGDFLGTIVKELESF